MESVKSTTSEGNGYLGEVLNSSRTSSTLPNTENISCLNTTTNIPDEGAMKQCTVNSEIEEPTTTVSRYTEPNDARERQQKKLFKTTEIITDKTISSVTSVSNEQTENNSEDKETSKCNTGSGNLAETRSADKPEIVHVEVEPDERSIPENTEPKNVLQLVNLDHQYIAASGISNWKENATAHQGQDNISRESSGIAPSYTMVKLYNKPEPSHGRLRQILTNNESKSKVLDNDIQTSIPNAALIQKHFQDMLAMTSLHSIEEPDERTRTEEENRVPDMEKEDDFDSDAETASGAEDTGFITTDEEDQSGDETIENKNNEPAMRVGLSDSCGAISGNEMPYKVRQESKSASALCGPKVIERNTWLRVRRDIEDGLRDDAMLCYVFDKLLHRWGEYLQLSHDKLMKFELENARQSAAVEVSEMLEDKGRYVWQLLEDIMNSRDPI